MLLPGLPLHALFTSCPPAGQIPGNQSGSNQIKVKNQVAEGGSTLLDCAVMTVVQNQGSPCGPATPGEGTGPTKGKLVWL